MKVRKERGFTQLVPAYVNLILDSQNNSYFPGILVRKPFQGMDRFHLCSFKLYSALEVELGLQCILNNLSVGI